MRITIPSLVVAGVAAAACAQTSVYYLSDPENNRLNAYQNQTQLWDQPQQYGYESPIAVVSNAEGFRTAGYTLGQVGGRYNTFGDYIGPSYTTRTQNTHWDSTSNRSTNNYLVGWRTDKRDVYATDTDFENPVVLFSIDSGDALGITYDPTNDSLWIADFSGGLVTNYDLAGNVLSSFNSGLANQGALALDWADDTLWQVEWLTQTVYQWDKAGNLLQSYFDPNMTPNPLGGEMAIPAPGVLALLGVGGLFAGRRRR